MSVAKAGVYLNVVVAEMTMPGRHSENLEREDVLQLNDFGHL